MDNAWLYTDKVKEHFMHPRNLLADEPAFDADGKGMNRFIHAAFLFPWKPAAAMVWVSAFAKG